MPSSRIFMRRIGILTPKMSIAVTCIAAICWLITSCESKGKEEEKRNLVTKEHAALIGTWQEQDSLGGTTWIFDQYEVKWKGFRHYYRVSDDSLIISGVVYSILEQSDNQMKLKKVDGKPSTLIRKN